MSKNIDTKKEASPASFFRNLTYKACFFNFFLCFICFLCFFCVFQEVNKAVYAFIYFFSSFVVVYYYSLLYV